MKHIITKLLAALFLSLLAAPVAAQTSPNFTLGFVPTPAQWNDYFAKKQDLLANPPLPQIGGTLSGPLITAPSSSLSSGFNIPPGTAPLAPNNGDIWETAAGFFARINGGTFGPLTSNSITLNGVTSGASTISVFPTLGQLQIATGQTTGGITPLSVVDNQAGNFVRQVLSNSSSANNSIAQLFVTTGIANAFGNFQVSNGVSVSTVSIQWGSGIVGGFSFLNSNTVVGTLNNGWQIGAAPTGGDKGAGTLNMASAIFTNGAIGITGTATNDSAPAGLVGEFIQSSCSSPTNTATVTITIASPGVITWASHGFQFTADRTRQDACPVVFTTTGALPTGLTAGTTYWVAPSSISGNNFSVATSAANAIAGTLVNTSGSQSGTQTGTAGAPLTTATPKDVTAVPLTAGDWECRGSVVRRPNGTTSFTQLKSSLVMTSTTDGSLSLGTMDQFSTAANVPGANNDTAIIIMPSRFSLAAAGNLYLDGNDTFTLGTDISYGTVACRRMR